MTGPVVSGVVERTLGEMVLLRDADGIVEVYAHPGDGTTHLAVRAYRFGDEAAAVAAREEPAWRLDGRAPVGDRVTRELRH